MRRATKYGQSPPLPRSLSHEGRGRLQPFSLDGKGGDREDFTKFNCRIDSLNQTIPAEHPK